jgi:hypothetical protein
MATLTMLVSSSAMKEPMVTTLSGTSQPPVALAARAWTGSRSDPAGEADAGRRAGAVGRRAGRCTVRGDGRLPGGRV